MMSCSKDPKISYSPYWGLWWWRCASVIVLNYCKELLLTYGAGWTFFFIEWYLKEVMDMIRREWIISRRRVRSSCWTAWVCLVCCLTFAVVFSLNKQYFRQIPDISEIHKFQLEELSYLSTNLTISFRSLLFKLSLQVQAALACNRPFRVSSHACHGLLLLL